MDRVTRGIYLPIIALIIIIAAALTFGVRAQTQLPFPLTTVVIPEQGSAASVSNYVFKANTSSTALAKSLMTLTVTTGASAGFILIFDGTVIPSNGAQSTCAPGTNAPCLLYCYSSAANASTAFVWPSPLNAQTGIVAAFSTTGCDTLTASATAKFTGQGI